MFIILKCRALKKKDDLFLKGNRVNNKHLLCVLMSKNRCSWHFHTFIQCYYDLKVFLFIS